MVLKLWLLKDVQLPPIKFSVSHHTHHTHITHTVDLPVITEQPVSLHNLLTGQNATFTLTASGMDLSYLWQYADGSPLQQSIEGVTTPTLTIRGVTGEDIKSYQCAVSNNAGTILSVQVNLTLCKTITSYSTINLMSLNS